jgi:hypothetical protein
MIKVEQCLHLWHAICSFKCRLNLRVLVSYGYETRRIGLGGLVVRSAWSATVYVNMSTECETEPLIKEDINNDR